MSDRLPTEPGMYYWDEWDKVVKVYALGKGLACRVYSHWQPVKISPRIAGRFTPVDDSGKPLSSKEK